MSPGPPSTEPRSTSRGVRLGSRAGRFRPSPLAPKHGDPPAGSWQRSEVLALMAALGDGADAVREAMGDLPARVRSGEPFHYWVSKERVGWEPVHWPF